MSKLTITGKASDKFMPDTEQITIRFQYHAKNSAEASQKVLSECEAFLKELSEWGISPDHIHSSRDNINQEYFDRDFDVTTTREVKIELPFNMEFNNSIIELVQERQLNIDFDISYSLSNYQEIHNELLKKALEDSKKKAELIAGSMEQKITGIDKLDMSDRYDDKDWMLCECERPFNLNDIRIPKLSDKLKAPLMEESESVEVVWNMTE